MQISRQIQFINIQIPSYPPLTYFTYSPPPSPYFDQFFASYVFTYPCGAAHQAIFIWGSPPPLQPRAVQKLKLFIKQRIYYFPATLVTRVSIFCVVRYICILCKWFVAGPLIINIHPTHIRLLGKPQTKNVFF